jgi:hypothetical protein
MNTPEKYILFQIRSLILSLKFTAILCKYVRAATELITPQLPLQESKGSFLTLR